MIFLFLFFIPYDIFSLVMRSVISKNVDKPFLIDLDVRPRSYNLVELKMFRIHFVIVSNIVYLLITHRRQMLKQLFRLKFNLCKGKAVF